MTAAAPSGVVTFLFTAIEGSTRRWEADAAAMRAALMTHDEMLRSSIEAHDGFLFSHTGDGVVAAFASPRSAVDAAVAAQRALGLPVRMGLATDSTFTSTSASGICSHVAIRSRATCQSDAHQRLFSDAMTRRFGFRTQTLYPNQLSTRARQQTRLQPQTTTIEFGPTWSHGWSGRVGIIVMAEQEPLAMPLEEAMRTQRAIRRIKSDPVDDSLLLHLLELAMKAPTGSNAQNWEFIVVKDREVVAKLGRLNRRAMNLVSPIYKRIIARRMDDQMLRIEKAVRWQADHFDDIPVVVVACLKGVVAPWPSMAASSAYGSIYPAVQNFLLAARAAGLGATLITMPLWSKLLAQRALGLPWNVTPCAVIPLGWPIGKYGPTTRRPVGEFVSLDQYGNRAFL